MRRFLVVAAGVGLIVTLSASGALPAAAQGAVKPVMAFIVNDATAPVPVLVTNEPLPPAPDLVKCTLTLGGGSVSSPIFMWKGFLVLSAVQCPAGVEAVDVQRVFFTPEVTQSTPGNDALHWQITLGVSTDDVTLDPSEAIAILTAGAPDTRLAQPVRLDTGMQGNVAYKFLASTGLADIDVSFTGTFIFEGVPVS